MTTPWMVRFDGNEWTEESLIAAEAVDVARLSGCGWAIDPRADPLIAAALVAVLCCTRLGHDLDEAMAKVREMAASDLLACIAVPATTPPGLPPEPQQR